MRLTTPKQLLIKNNHKEPQTISRISASGYNSAAYNEDDNFFVWGGTTRGKLGLPS